MFYPAPEPAELFHRFAKRCYVLVDDVKVRVSLRTLRNAWDAGTLPLEVSEEDIAVCKASHEATLEKMERFRIFCLDDGIDPDTCKRVEPDGRVGIYAPDGMGYPTLVLYEGEYGG